MFVATAIVLSHEVECGECLGATVDLTVVGAGNTHEDAASMLKEWVRINAPTSRNDDIKLAVTELDDRGNVVGSAEYALATTIVLRDDLSRRDRT